MSLLKFIAKNLIPSLSVFTFMVLAVVSTGCNPAYRSEFKSDTTITLPDEIKLPVFDNIHLQGITSDYKEHIFCSYTTRLVKINLHGEVLIEKNVPWHHGDLAYYQGMLFVTTNFGAFNELPGQSNSWVYVYDAIDLAFIKRYAIPEVLNGAGSIAIHADTILISGGLPKEAHPENYPSLDFSKNLVYEYNQQFIYRNTHAIGKANLMGIQTSCYNNGAWYFGCYGSPGCIMKATRNKTGNLTEEYRFENVDASFALLGLGNNNFYYSNRPGATSLKKIQLNPALSDSIQLK